MTQSDWDQRLATCDPDTLQRLADEHIRNERLEWAEWTPDQRALRLELSDILSGYHFNPESAEDAFGPDSSRPLMDWLISGLFSDLLERHPGIKQVASRCMALRVANLKSPHGWTISRPPHGVILLIHGGLPGLFYAILGHAFSSLTYEPVGDQHTGVTVKELSEAQLLRAAAHIFFWLHPDAAFDPQYLPDIFAGRPTTAVLTKVLAMSEQFVLAHECAHGFVELGIWPEADPTLTDFLKEEGVSGRAYQTWTRELTADVRALSLVTQAATSGGPSAVSAAAMSCFVAIQVLDAIEWLGRLPSTVQFPPQPGDQNQLLALTDHPPADLRLHIIMEELANRFPNALSTAQELHISTVVPLLLMGLHEVSQGGCVAPGLDPVRGSPLTLCRRSRSSHGWYCVNHEWSD